MTAKDETKVGEMYKNMKEQFQYYIDHQEQFIEEYNGKTIVLKNFEVIGVYEDEWGAVTQSKLHYEPGTYIVQRVSPGDEAYSVTIASNMAFAGIE